MAECIWSEMTVFARLRRSVEGDIFAPKPLIGSLPVMVGGRLP